MNEMNEMNEMTDIIEQMAKEIYELMPYDEEGTKPKWVERGNSHKQNEARGYAQAAYNTMKDWLLNSDWPEYVDEPILADKINMDLRYEHNRHIFNAKAMLKQKLEIKEG